MRRLTMIVLLLVLCMSAIAWRHSRHNQPEQDHYKVLGVSSDATTAEIKRAFRKQAVQYHPDRTNNDPVAADKFVKINEASQVLSDPSERRRFDQTRGGGGGGFGFQQRRRDFRSRGRRENVQTFNFGGREFRYEFRQDRFQRQQWGRPRQPDPLSSFAMPLLLGSILFVIYMFVLIEKLFEPIEEDQDQDSDDERRSNKHSRRRQVPHQRKLKPKPKRFDVLRPDTLALKGKFIVVAVVRDVLMSPMEQNVWGKVYAKLHAAANLFATDRCLLFRKLLSRDAGTPPRLGDDATDYVEQEVYEAWIKALLKDKATAKLDILESIHSANKRKHDNVTTTRGIGVREKERTEPALVTGRRLDALCILRGSRMTSAVISCEDSVIGYYDALVKQDILSGWLARLLDGTNMAKLSPIDLASWPALPNGSTE